MIKTKDIAGYMSQCTCNPNNPCNDICYTRAVDNIYFVRPSHGEDWVDKDEHDDETD